MIALDIVLQGPIQPYTARVADMYTRLPFVNSVILSCWDTCPDIDSSMIDWENPKIYMLKSKDPDFPGSWNRNRLIKSSYEGLKAVVMDYAVKMRADQIVSLESMQMMYDYYFKRCDIDVAQFEEFWPSNKIGVMGICKDYPYHPLDHIFWGHKHDLLNLFSVEHDMSYYDEKALGRPYAELYTRSEVYITTPYVAKFSKDAEKHRQEPDTYLKDNAPKVLEALESSRKWMPELFITFPMIQMQWPKNGMAQFHYDVMATERGGHTYWGENP